MQLQRLERSEQHVLRSSSVQTSSGDHAEFVLDTLGYVEPMKLGVYQLRQLRQAAVELPITTDHTSCRV